MRLMWNPLNLILLLIIAFVIFKLRSVLGLRNLEDTKKPRYDAYRLNRDAFRDKPRQADTEPADAVAASDSSPEAVAASDLSPEAVADQEPRISQDAPQDAPETDKTPAALETGRGIALFRQHRPEFDEPAFLAGAARAYEMILLAFAAGDLSSVRPLLGDDVYAGFGEAIATRTQNQQRLVTKIIDLKRPRLEDAALVPRDGTLYAQLEVRFRAELVSHLIASDAEPNEDALPPPIVSDDLWVFEQALHSEAANWQLIRTSS